MVSVAIFAVVVMIAIGSIMSILDANRKAQSLNVIMNNLNFSFESMIRDIRTGSKYYNCPAGGSPVISSICFTDKDGRDKYYALDTTSGGPNSGLIIASSTDPSISTGPITSSEVTIEDMSFKIMGNVITDPGPPEKGDKLPSIVLLHIKGYSGKDKSKSYFNIQTLITQRVIDTQDIP